MVLNSQYPLSFSYLLLSRVLVMCCSTHDEDLYLIPEPLISLPVPPMEHQVQEGFKELYGGLHWAGEPEACAHAGVDIRLRTDVVWVMRPPLQKVICTPISNLIGSQSKLCCLCKIASTGVESCESHNASLQACSFHMPDSCLRVAAAFAGVKRSFKPEV